MTKSLALGNTCAACGVGRKAKNLRYDADTFLPYCDSPYICNENHPNSTKNIIERQSEKELLSAEAIRDAYQQHLVETFDIDPAERIRRLMTKPTTFRVLNPDQAKFLVALQDEKELPSMADTIRYCVDVMMQNNGNFYKEHQEKMEIAKKEEATAKIVQELESQTVPELASVDETNEGSWTF